MTMNNTAKETVILERRFVPSGSLIVEEGERGNSAFLIQSGYVRVYTGEADKEIELAKLGPGQIFGEMALVFDAPRTANVKTLEDCNLIVIAREVFQGKLEGSDPTIRAVIPMLMKRLAQTNNVLLNRQGTFDDMIEATNSVYQSVSASLPAVQKKTLENNVLPKLDEFLKAVRSFQEKYSESE